MSESGSGSPAVVAGLGQAGTLGKAPSLFSGRETNSGRQPEKISILSSLDRGGVSRKSRGLPGRRSLLVLGGVLVACAVFFAVRGVWLNDAPDRSNVMPVAIQPESPPPSRVVAEGTVSQAATIENVVQEPLAADSAPGGVRAAAESDTQVAQAIRAEPVEPVAGSPVRALEAPPLASPSGSTSRNTDDRSHPASLRTSTKLTQARPGEKRTPTVVSDSDAALLSALVAHETGTLVNVKSSSSSTANDIGGSSVQRKESSARKRNSGFDPKLDVVENDKSVPTAELLRRCGSLGLVEGFLCKMRVCSNRQGDDPACPQPVSPAARGG